jgi:lysophospholipase L1-like esterase
MTPSSQEMESPKIPGGGHIFQTRFLDSSVVQGYPKETVEGRIQIHLKKAVVHGTRRPPVHFRPSAKKTFRFAALILFITSSGCLYPPPTIWESQVQAYEAQDQIDPPPGDAIVIIGSSSIRLWETIENDLAPLPIIARGFGGSTMNDAAYYADRLVTVYNPRMVVIYEGDNDIFFGISPERVQAAYFSFISNVHGTLPDVPIYFLSIKPSVSRWHLWPQSVAANTRIETQSAQDPLLHYIDVASGMLDGEGNVRPELFAGDGLHMNTEGYAVWTDIIRPILINDFFTPETDLSKADRPGWPFAWSW